MTQTVVIRVMSKADLDEVLKIAAGDRNAPAWPRSAYLAALEPEANPGRVVLVAEDAPTSQITAFAVARLVSTEAELETIVTATGFRRRGMGRMLFVCLADRLEKAGATEILLEVRESNQSARAFYAALGFSGVGRRVAYYTDPAEDAVLLRMALGDGGDERTSGSRGPQV